MAEAKPTKTTAADKRKAADQALEDRIKARKEASVKGGIAKPEEPKVSAPAPSTPPFEPAGPTSAAPNPDKKPRKPREAKTKAAPDAELAELIKAAQEKAVKAALKQAQSDHADLVKGMVDKTWHDTKVAEAYEKGFAHGKKQALADVKAALKGGK